MKKIAIAFAVLIFAPVLEAKAVEVVLEKHIVPAPAPIDQPIGAVTPDGSFNIRDENSPFYSPKLADALGLDADGRMTNGEYLGLNHAVYTVYRDAAGPGPVTDVLILMPGTWAGAMSMDGFARDLIRLMAKEGRGFEVWLLDRRSEQIEDHIGLRWAMENKDGLEIDNVLMGISDYYLPAFDPDGQGRELMGRVHVPLDHDSVRFIANHGVDTTIRDWRAVVLEAHRRVGNVLAETEGGLLKPIKSPGRHVFIGGHSLGGSLTVTYAAYDFDRRPGHMLLGKDDVDGLVLLEGGGFPGDEAKVEKAKKYRDSIADYYKPGEKVYFDMDMFGIRYAPSTMLSLAISGFAADRARGRESVFPQYSRPRIVQVPHITNEAMLGYAIDDDTSAFFIARVSIGHPTGEIGKQLRYKTMNVPLDPGDCPVATPWRPGHRLMDQDFVYGWVNIDGPDPAAVGSRGIKCAEDDPEVTDFYAFARSVYAGAAEYVEAPWMSMGPNDFAEWYFPPRLSMDSRYLGQTVLDEKGVELIAAAHVGEIDLPVIAFYGDDSMGEFRFPELNNENFPAGVLARKSTSVHLMKGYTHLDITAATRNNQPDLVDGFADYNGCAVYTARFIKQIAGW